MTQTETQDLKPWSLQQKLTEALGQRLSDVVEAGKACKHACIGFRLSIRNRPGAQWNPDVTAWETHDMTGPLTSCIPAAPRLYPCSTDWPETQDAMSWNNVQGSEYRPLICVNEITCGGGTSGRNMLETSLTEEFHIFANTFQALDGPVGKVLKAGTKLPSDFLC